ncbi:MAG: cytochrome c [Woeseiaceae bacterium]
MRLKNKTLLVSAILLGTVFAGSVVSIAETTSLDAFDYRKAVMTSLKGHIGASSMHVRGLVSGPEYLVEHAQGLANGVSEIKTLFAEGSNVQGSDALAVIWEDPDAFNAAIEKAEKATAAFVKATEDGDKAAITAAFREVGGSCKGCHDKFRAPQD